MKFLLQDLKKTLFDDVFPVDRNRSDVCAFGVEANKVHTPRLLALQKYYTNLGLNTLHAHNEWGFTSGISTGTTQQPETVKAFSLPKFIELQVMNQMIPDKLLPNDKPPAVVMKMDIEVNR